MILALGVAVSVTGFAYWSNLRYQHEQLMEKSLNLARQIGAQAEALTLSARQQGLKNPYTWSVGILSQGYEPQIVRLKHLQRESALAFEKYDLPIKGDTFEYEKVLAPETGDSIGIKISLGYQGFFGAASRFMEDLYLLCFFLLLLTPLLMLGFLHHGTRDLQWLAQMETLLTESSLEYRNTLRNTQTLSQIANHSRQMVDALRVKIHKSIREIHQYRASIRQTDRFLAQIETCALDAVAQASRMGHEGHRWLNSSGRLCQAIDQLKCMSRDNDVVLREMEKELEPCSLEADLAIQVYEPLPETSKRIHENVLRTSQTLKNQMQLIHKIQKDDPAA